MWLSVCLSVYDKKIEEYMYVNDSQEKMCLPTQKIQEEVCPWIRPQDAIPPPSLEAAVAGSYHHEPQWDDWALSPNPIPKLLEAPDLSNVSESWNFFSIIFYLYKYSKTARLHTFLLVFRVDSCMILPTSGWKIMQVKVLIKCLLVRG